MQGRTQFSRTTIENNWMSTELLCALPQTRFCYLYLPLRYTGTELTFWMYLQCNETRFNPEDHKSMIKQLTPDTEVYFHELTCPSWAGHEHSAGVECRARALPEPPGRAASAVLRPDAPPTHDHSKVLGSWRLGP